MAISEEMRLASVEKPYHQVAAAARANLDDPNIPILKFFAWTHLPPMLQNVSAPFGRLALDIAGTLPPNAEREVALRKLLESKDAAVRAAL